MGLIIFSLAFAAIQLPVEPGRATDSADRSESVSESAILLPKGYELDIRIDDKVGSKISKTGDYFDISLASAISIDGIEVVPAGAQGEGQVVHAAKGGFGGGAGELILAARYIEYQGIRIPLRSFKFGRTGDDNTAEAIALNAALGPLGFLVSGGNVETEPGTIGRAKIAADIELTIGGDKDVK